ncbi:hypothetical protein [Salinicoccus sp. HZC-1]|uniref:hypothetical protein n=1 Tax=Salinicoccus sp. HZC-1 TaxID=3385497 RepID=UPI00398B702D
MQFFINYKYFPPLINEVLVNSDPVSIIYSKSSQADEYMFEALSLYDEFPLINSKAQLEKHLNTIMVESFSIYPNKSTLENYDEENYSFENEMINQLWKIKQKWSRMQP